jgi:hypothetical protein
MQQPLSPVLPCSHHTVTLVTDPTITALAAINPFRYATIPTTKALARYATTFITIILASYVTISITTIAPIHNCACCHNYTSHVQPAMLTVRAIQPATSTAGSRYNDPATRKSGNQ